MDLFLHTYQTILLMRMTETSELIIYIKFKPYKTYFTLIIKNVLAYIFGFVARVVL